MNVLDLNEPSRFQDSNGKFNSQNMYIFLIYDNRFVCPGHIHTCVILSS